MNYSPELLEAVELLDTDNPGWHRKVDLEKFYLMDCCLCVVGQAYPGGWASLSEQNYSSETCDLIDAAITNFEAKMDAFFGPDTDCSARRTFSASSYASQWASLIAERQAADSFDATLATERIEIEGVPC